MDKARTMRACLECGKSFYGSKDRHYCPECAKKRKSASVLKMRICQDCGKEFVGYPRSKRCQECALKQKRKTDRDFHRKGASRKLGSVDKCQICGAEYIVTSGRQKFCESCKNGAYLEWQREHKTGYAKDSGQDIKKQERRESQKKICVYCLKEFYSSMPTNTCSDYCREQNEKINMAKSETKRGKSSKWLERLEKEREEYRKKARL